MSSVRAVRPPRSERAFLALAAAFGIFYFAWSFFSRGFFQDDEIGHFLEAIRFWNDPAVILGPWSRPGFKLLYIGPALLGLVAAHALACLFAAGTVYLTGRLASELGLRHRFLVMVFCGFQPLFYQLSFRTFAEIPAAFFLALSLLLFHKGRFLLSALVLSYLFTVRQETGLLAVAAAVFFLARRRWVPLLALLWAPLALAIAGAGATGEPAWLLTSFLRGGKNPGFAKPDPLHYVRAFVPIFGIPVTALALAAFGALADPKGIARASLPKSITAYGITLVLFVLNVVLSSTSSLTPALGIWRNLLVFSPALAIVAGIGLEVIVRGTPLERRIALGATIGLALCVLLLWSHAHNYFAYDAATRDYRRFGIVLLLLFSLLLVRSRPVLTRRFPVFLGALTVGSTVLLERPIPLSEEHTLVRDIAAFCRSGPLGGRPILVNHPMFAFYAWDGGTDVPSYPRATMENIRRAGAHTLIVWDTHYGYRPELFADAHFDSLVADPRLRVVREEVGSSIMFSIVVIEKQ